MTGRSKRFLDPKTLDEAAAEIARLAEAESVQVALAGGYALQLYGSPRLTGDVDVVVDELIQALPPGPALSFGGVQTEAPNGVPVDMMLRDDDYARLYKEALRAARPHEGAPMPVVTPEYLVAMKMVAGRPRDEADLDWLITADVADLRRARKIVREHLGPYAAGELDRIVEVARWRASRGSRAE